MPTGQDYREAIQNPKLNFGDPELQQGEPLRDALGLPRPISGNFASVFTVVTNGKRYAVKCFFRSFGDQFERYTAISAYLNSVERPWEVDFQFQQQGIRVAGKWHPIVKMEWADAIRLDKYVEAHLGHPQELLALAGRFAELVADLGSGGIAHGDLQHGNILVTSAGELRLVDYDGMYVPALSGRESHELGHPNYQHPRRSQSDFGPALDNFSAWVIYISLLALSIDPSIWARVDAGEENLVFRKQDFESGIYSAGFGALQLTSDATLARLASELKAFVGETPLAVPALTPVKIELPEAIGPVDFAPSSVPKLAASASATQSGLPQWMDDGTAKSGPTTPSTPGIPTAGLQWMIGRLAEPPLVAAPVPQAAARSVLYVSVVVVAILAALGITGFVSIAVTGGVSVALILAAGTFEFIAFSRTSENRAHKAARSVVTERRKVLKTAQQELDVLDERRRKADEQEKAEVDRLAQQQQRVQKQELEKLAASQKSLQSRLDDVARRRLALQGEEQRERTDALKRLQEQTYINELSRSTVEKAKLARVGRDVKSTLAAYGMRSAADIKGVQLYQGNQAAIVRADGQALRVPGIGPAKAKVIQTWLVDVQNNARRLMPTTLPPQAANEIQQRYIGKLGAFGAEEQNVRVQAQKEADEIRANSQRGQAGLLNEMNAARNVANVKRHEIGQSLRPVSKMHSEAQWAVAQSLRDTEAYRRVTFPRYLLSASRLR
jgi:hypothetical protein